MMGSAAALQITAPAKPAGRGHRARRLPIDATGSRDLVVSPANRPTGY